MQKLNEQTTKRNSDKLENTILAIGWVFFLIVVVFVELPRQLERKAEYNAQRELAEVSAFVADTQNKMVASQQRP